MKKEAVKNVVTIGTSAGGISAVSRLVTTFGPDLNAAVFIVIHLSRNAETEVILGTIQKETVLKCIIPEDGELIQNNTIYLAPADHHMLLETGMIHINKGAYENHWRPSIDVLFRSAAAAYNSCVTGIILTGLLDDGTSGMFAIKRSGGMCIIQDPAEADFPDMPNSVLHHMEVDYKVSVGEMGYVLADLFSRGYCVETAVPEDVHLEAEIARRMSSEVEDLKELGEFSTISCPDCGGVLVKVSSDVIPRYRCYTGHTFTEKALEIEQLKGIEYSLWVVIRGLEERRNLLLNRERQVPGVDSSIAGQLNVQRAEAIHQHIQRIKEMLKEIGK